MRFEDLAKEEGARIREEPKVGGAETAINRAVGWLPVGNRIVDAASAAALEGSRAIGKAAPGLSRALSSLPVVGQFAPVAESGVKLAPQAQAELARMGTPEEKPAPDPGLVDTYRQVRDTRAERTEAGSRQNPWAGRLGALTGFGLSLLAPLPKVGTGLKGAVATGAGYGALQGLTEGKADLTRGDVGQAVEDTLVGGAFGAGAGAVGYGLQKLGERGVRALRNARQDTLAQETLKAQEEAAAAGAEAAKAGEAERKMVGQAREMNKRVDARAAAKAEREAARAAREEGRAQKLLERARQREAPPPDPDTSVLEGMYGKAHQAQQSRTKDALQYQRQMGDSDVPTKVSESWQDYIDRAPEALENPPALRRKYMEDYLRQKYGSDVAERLMRERVGPGGEILPRPNAAPPAAQERAEVTGIQDAGDWARRGQYERAGGGGSAWQGYGSEGKTIAALPEDLPGAGVLTGPPVRKPGNMSYDVGGQRGPEFSRQVTAGGPGPSLAEVTSPGAVADFQRIKAPGPAAGATRVRYQLASMLADLEGREQSYYQKVAQDPAEYRQIYAMKAKVEGALKRLDAGENPASLMAEIRGQSNAVGAVRSRNSAMRSAVAAEAPEQNRLAEILMDRADYLERRLTSATEGEAPSIQAALDDVESALAALHRGDTPTRVRAMAGIPDDQAANQVVGMVERRQPTLAEEAEAAMAARRAAAAGANVGRGATLPAGQPRQEILPPLERAPVPVGPRAVDAPWVPNAPRVAPEPVLSAPPARRPGAAPMSLDVGGRPGPLSMEPTPVTPPPTPPPAAVPTLHGGEGAMPPVGPTGQAPPINEVQDVTRLAGPADVGPLAAERAAQREQHAIGAVVRGGYEGVRSGNNVAGAVLGGLAGLRREALRDPAVKARVLSAAKVHLLAQVSPEVFARVGAPLAQAATSGDGRYQTMRYVYARKDPEFRKAEAEAAAKASHLTDEQLMDLISGAAPQ